MNVHRRVNYQALKVIMKLGWRENSSFACFILISWDEILRITNHQVVVLYWIMRDVHLNVSMQACNVFPLKSYAQLFKASVQWKMVQRSKHYLRCWWNAVFASWASIKGCALLKDSLVWEKDTRSFSRTVMNKSHFSNVNGKCIKR